MHRTGLTGFTAVLVAMARVMPGPAWAELGPCEEALAALVKYSNQWDQPEYAS